MKRRFAILTFVLLSVITNLKCQIYFKNNNTEPVYVAFAQYVIKPSGGTWQTKGWWTVNPGRTHLAYENPGPNDSIGYWCMTTLSNDIFEGTKPLLVHPDEKFNIQPADKKEVADAHPALEWYKFRMMRLKPGTTTGTITFKQ